MSRGPRAEVAPRGAVADAQRPRASARGRFLWKIFRCYEADVSAGRM